MRNLAPRLFAACCLALVGYQALAEDAPDRKGLESALQEVTGQPQYKHAHWGLLVVDQKTGDVLFEQNADKLFAPASTTKLYSVACALDCLGADHRFQTPLVRRGDINEQGELNGD